MRSKMPANIRAFARSASINGTAAGGGYELALAADQIILVDDGSSAVSLPELPLLAVLPGTGGLTRVTDKRKVRRDLADVFCTIEEGIKGKRAVQWRLVDEVVPQTKLETRAIGRCHANWRRNRNAQRKARAWLSRRCAESSATRRSSTSLLAVAIDRAQRTATITLTGPDSAAADNRRRHGEGGRGVLAAADRARTR